MIPKFEEGSLEEELFFLGRQTPDALPSGSAHIQMGCDPPYVYPSGTVIRCIWITLEEFTDHFCKVSDDTPV